MNYRGLRLVKNVQHLNRLEYNKNYSSYEVDTYVDLFLRSNFDWSIFRIPNLNKAYRINKDIESLEKRKSTDDEWKDIFLNSICDEYDRRYYFAHEEEINNKINEINFKFMSMCLYYMSVFARYVEEIRRRVSSPYFYYGVTDINEHYVELKDRKRIPMNTPNSVFIRIESKDYQTKTLKPKFTEPDTKRDIIAKYIDIIDNIKAKSHLAKRLNANYDEIVVPKYEVIDGYKYITLKALSCDIPLALNNNRNSSDFVKIYRTQWVEKGMFIGIVNPLHNKDTHTLAKSILNPEYMSTHANFWNKFVFSEGTKLVVNFTTQIQEEVDIDLIENKLSFRYLEYKNIFDEITK